jgi:hypothetical protein
MKPSNRCSLIPALSILLLLGTRAAFPITHQFVALDEGLENLLYVNQNDTTKNWLVSYSSVYPARDLQLVGNNRILLAHNFGYTEYNLTTGAIMRQLMTYDSVTSVRRLPNGQTLLFGIQPAGKGIYMVKLDSNNVQLGKTVVFPGNYVRLVRQTNQGTVLMACNDSVFEADTNTTSATGAYIWKKKITWTGPLSVAGETMHMWKVVRLDNGHIFLSGGYAAFMAEVDSSGKFIDTIGEAPQPAGVGPFFYAMFQRFTNGHTVVANWQGHGPGGDTAGKVHELIEFDSTKAIVWTWDDPALISSLQEVLVLDSLNTNLLYDDRDGYMKPLTSTTSVIPPALNRSPASAGGGLSLTPDGRLQLFDLLGRSASPAQWTGGKPADVGAGIYILKSSAGSWQYRQLRN